MSVTLENFECLAEYKKKAIDIYQMSMALENIECLANEKIYKESIKRQIFKS